MDGKSTEHPDINKPTIDKETTAVPTTESGKSKEESTLAETTSPAHVVKTTEPKVVEEKSAPTTEPVKQTKTSKTTVAGADETTERSVITTESGKSTERSHAETTIEADAEKTIRSVDKAAKNAPTTEPAMPMSTKQTSPVPDEDEGKTTKPAIMEVTSAATTVKKVEGSTQAEAVRDKTTKPAAKETTSVEATTEVAEGSKKSTTQDAEASTVANPEPAQHKLEPTTDGNLVLLTTEAVTVKQTTHQHGKILIKMEAKVSVKLTCMI